MSSDDYHSELTVQWFYLHGLASSPQSRKAQRLRDRLREQGQVLHRVDLNLGGFSQLTVSRQIRQVSALISPHSRVALIGSSLGGLTAAWVAQESAHVERLLLLAPAFGFPDCWLTPAQLQHWQDSGYRDIYHYGEGRSLPLHYHFVEDARRYLPQGLTHPVPTTILHGIHDEIIPIQASRDYAATRPWVHLIEVDSDHALTHLDRHLWPSLLNP
ncbi:MAG: YqiA/YcfP family alpha/beta fold hydrolase [Sodalinema sp.]|uniref:YqiA/YcfP family alpha/beta fold hydrolase n=1 Tax=Sodalinema sp. TaxID=3080550 RepID=UPI00396F382A